jgi:DNA adenine methylase
MPNSPIAYFGGKSRLAPAIIKQIPRHTCYVEPFCGAAWVFFKKPESKVEVLNDRDNNIVNIYRVIQHHPEEFLRQFKTLLISRKIFELMKRHDDECLTDIHRAVKWFYLLKQAFASIVTSNSAFGYSTSGFPRLNILDMESGVIDVHHRLARVTIESLPYDDVLRRYDRPHTFFYLDPPYYGIKAYRFNFEPKDFERLAEVLAGLKGKFLMSINEHKVVRRIFRAFRIGTVATKYSSMNGRHWTRGRTARELLIRNY